MTSCERQRRGGEWRQGRQRRRSSNWNATRPSYVRYIIRELSSRGLFRRACSGAAGTSSEIEQVHVLQVKIESLFLSVVHPT